MGEPLPIRWVWLDSPVGVDDSDCRSLNSAFDEFQEVVSLKEGTRDLFSEEIFVVGELYRDCGKVGWKG